MFAVPRLAGQTAGLGAEAAVAAALAEHRAHIALAGHRHAQRAMHEGLHLEGGRADDLPDLLLRALAGQHDAGKAHLLEHFGPLDVVHHHLGGAVQPKRRRAPAQQRRRARVLHDDRVDPRRAGGFGVGEKLRDLILAHDDIERQVDPDAPDVAAADGIRQMLQGKIFGAAAGVECPGAEIDRVRPAEDGRFKRRRVPGGREHLRQAAHFTSSLVWPFISCPSSWRRRWAFSRLTSSSSMRALAASSRYSEIWVRMRSAFSSLRL